MTDNDFDEYADENEPKVIETGRLIHVSAPGHTREVDITVRVDTDGLVELDHYVWYGWYGPKPAGKGYNLTDPKDKAMWDMNRDVLGYLAEWELIALKAIGPEDSEYFATDKLLAAIPELINPYYDAREK